MLVSLTKLAIGARLVRVARCGINVCCVGLMVVATESRATPPITNETKQLVASDAAASDNFGVVADLSGDTAAIGANKENSSQGAVYVYGRNQGGTNNWGEIKKVVASDGSGGDEFGGYVSLDSTTLVVGAIHDDDDGTSSGAAYVFYKDQGGTNNWGQMAKLTASDAAAGDHFGLAVSIDGDIAAVGAPEENSAAGAVYLFERDEGGSDNWGQIKKITASDAAAGDDFGSAVGLDGNRLIVGADRDDDGATWDAGSAYIFYKDEGGTDNWGQVEKLTASDTSNFNDFFGRRVAIKGDIAAVGGDFQTGAGAAPGAVYVFHKDEGGTDNWGEAVKTVASDGQAGDGLGSFLSIEGNTIVAGASGADTLEGALYLFERDWGGVDNYGERAKFTNSSGAFGDTLGNGVGLAAPYIVSGAPGDDSEATGAGAAYVFEVPDFCEDGYALPYTVLNSGDTADEAAAGTLENSTTYIVEDGATAAFESETLIKLTSGFAVEDGTFSAKIVADACS